MFVHSQTLRVVAAALFLAATPLALADAALEERAPCPVSSQEQARGLAEVLFQQGDFQHSGACYQAAGEYALANRAFLKAVEPQSAKTAQQLSDQGEQAKALAHKLQRAFGVEH
ncbi:MAG TPA: hypothetical protein VI653_02420 [Steroidobacteraceae bacterium]